MGTRLTIVCSFVALALPAPAYAVVGGQSVAERPLLLRRGRRRREGRGLRWHADRSQRRAHRRPLRRRERRRPRQAARRRRIPHHQQRADGGRDRGLHAPAVPGRHDALRRRAADPGAPRDGRAHDRDGGLLAARRRDRERCRLGRDDRARGDAARPPAQRRPQGRDEARLRARQQQDSRRLLHAEHDVRGQSGAGHLLGRQRRPAGRHEPRAHRRWSGSRASAPAAHGPGIPASTPACPPSAAGRSARSRARCPPRRKSASIGARARWVGEHWDDAVDPRRALAMDDPRPGGRRAVRGLGRSTRACSR